MQTDQLEWFRNEILPLEPRLRAYLRKLTGGRQEIDDLIQEALARVITYAAWREVANPYAFTIRIARNLLFDEARRAKIVPITFLANMEDLSRASDAPDPEAALMGRDQLRLLVDAVSNLPDQCRKVFTLRKVYGLSPRAIADQLGLSVSTVEKHLNKALQLCSKHLALHGYGFVRKAAVRRARADDVNGQ